MFQKDKDFLDAKHVSDVLKTEYKEWIRNLSETEEKAIRKYTRNSVDKKPDRFFERLNAMLRGDYFRNDKAMLTRYADIISKALKRHKTEHSFLCHRGIEIDPMVGVDISKPFRFNQFISTSVNNSKRFKKKGYHLIYMCRKV